MSLSVPSSPRPPHHAVVVLSVGEKCQVRAVGGREDPADAASAEAAMGRHNLTTPLPAVRGGIGGGTCYVAT